VPPQDAAALADALAAMTADRAALRAMGEAGRRRWAAAFSADRLVAEVDALYRELASA
jgi:glycosyltransferase involved in cell wall biosynthesis